MEIRRPLKRGPPKLGPPDIYPQDPKQKEDELTSVNVKQGYTSAPLINGPNNLDEFGTAKNANIDAFGVYFSALLSEKHQINTLKDTQKKKQLVNTKEIWYVHAKTKHAVDNWFRDLANGTKSLGVLGKRIPIFNSKEGMFCQLYESRVPLAKAVWFIKMSAVHAIALSESSAKSKKRQVPDQYQELTAALTKYLKEICIRMGECYQQSQHHTQQLHHHHLQQQQQQQSSSSNQSQLIIGGNITNPSNINSNSNAFNNSQSILQQRNIPKTSTSLPTIPSSLLNNQPIFTANLHTSVANIMSSHTASTASLAATSMASLPIIHEDFVPTYSQWQYQTQLARYLFDEGLLDQYDFLCFLLELIEKKRPINDLLVKVITPLILEYVIDFSRSAVLSRRLAHICAKKLCQALNHHPMSARSLRKNEQNQSHLSSSNKFNQFDTRIPDTQTSSLLRNSSSSSNNNHITANSILDIVKAQIIETQNNNFIECLSNDQENDENNLYKNAIYILSSIIQVICIECPTAMVRHHIVEAKFSPMFQGSPLDHLPCLPSNLPMMESDLNYELRRSIHDAEREILHRSAMADSKWSCDSSSRSENSKGNLVFRLLSVLDILDKHNFEKIDSTNSIDELYSRIFPSIDLSINQQMKTTINQNNQTSAESNTNNLSIGILDLSSTSQISSQSNLSTDTNNKKVKKEHTQAGSSTSGGQPNVIQQDDQSLNINNSYEEHVIKLLCEWATTHQRTGEHRAIVVARLLEKRQSELQSVLSEMSQKNTPMKLKKTVDIKQSTETTKTEDSNNNHTKDNDNVEEQEVIQFSFQNILLKFLDEDSPIIEENQDNNIDNKKAFSNLVLLFSELIRCNVFSHYNYMCTLISRGMFNNLTKGSASGNSDSSITDSPAPNSNSVKQSTKTKESDSILANTIHGIGSGNGIHTSLSGNNNANKQSNNHLDPLSNNKFGSNSDQTLQSLGFSPVSSHGNASQSIDKSHGILDNHIDDVDADLGKILEDIKEGQQDEDMLLPDYLGGLRENNKAQTSINKLSPFGLGERASTLENPTHTPASIMSNRNFASTPNAVEDTKPNILPSATDDKNSIKKNPNEYRHMLYVKHFPVPDDENFADDINQRQILLYGFGKEARHAIKKSKDKLKDMISRLFHRKVCRDINDGGKVKRVLSKDWNPEASLIEFESMNNYEQHIMTDELTKKIIEMFTGVSNGHLFHLPTLESLTFVFDLFTMASNVTGLFELILPILEELSDVDAQIRLKCSSLSNQYTNSIASCIIGMLYRYHSCVLLLTKDELCTIFESLHKLVSHISNPSICTTSAERVIFYYLYDLYSSHTGRAFDQYSGLAQRIKQALIQNIPNISYNNQEHEWTSTYLTTIANHLATSQVGLNSSTNPILIAGSIQPSSSFNNFGQHNSNDISSNIRQEFYMPDSRNIREMNDLPAARYRFVCDAILLTATAVSPDLVNDIGVLCADVTSKCPPLIGDWMQVLQSLCCSAQRELGYRQLLVKINITDPLVMDNIAIFTAILVARRCLELDNFILKCAIGAIVAPLGPVDKQLTEPGVRLTCHLLLALFRNRESPLNQSSKNNNQALMSNTFNRNFSCYGNSTPNYSGNILNTVPAMGSLLQSMNRDQHDANGTRSTLNLKYLCDHHLLRAACCSIKTECHITLLKAIRVLAMWANPNNDIESQGRIKSENNFDDVSIDGLGGTIKDIDMHDGSSSLLNSDPNINIRHINLQTASLHQFADAILRLLCSQRWLHDKCLFDSEIFTTTETDKNLLLDPRMGPKQSQRLLYMICYNKSPEKQADIGLDDQGSDQVASIVKMFENLDVWSLRLSLMRLQFMFAHCKSQSNVVLNDWLDNLAKAIVDFFQKASHESDTNGFEGNKESSDDSSDNIKESKVSIKTMVTQKPSTSITNINKVWLIEPLLNKLSKPPNAVQSKIVKASAAIMESASVRANSLPSLNQTYLSTAAASTKFKERTLSQRGSASTNPSNLASTSLLGFQPFLSLVLSCLKNQDKERDTLLTSLNSQLYQAIHEKVDDIVYKQSLQDGLELRLCLIGQMFDSIQKSVSLTSDWATLLLLLIMNNLVDPQVDYRLYVSVLDMLATLIHAAYASDPIEQKEESKKQYQNLMKKFRKELTALEEKGFIQMKLINPLMPLVRQMTEVITCEPMGSLVDTKGEKVENFYSIDKKKGLKVSEVQEVSPWDLIEGHKNPAPLSWPWFGAIRLEQKPSRADENNRLMSWHTHSIHHNTSYFCETPNVDEAGPPGAKRSNLDKKPSQSNPLLKSLIEASDDSGSSILTKSNKDNDSISSQINNINDDAMSMDNPDESCYTGREDLVEDYCELPIDMLFDSTPVETIIEDIKSAMVAYQQQQQQQAQQQAQQQREQQQVHHPLPPTPQARSQTPLSQSGRSQTPLSQARSQTPLSQAHQQTPLQQPLTPIQHQPPMQMQSQLAPVVQHAAVPVVPMAQAVAQPNRQPPAKQPPARKQQRARKQSNAAPKQTQPRKQTAKQAAAAAAAAAAAQQQQAQMQMSMQPAPPQHQHYPPPQANQVPMQQSQQLMGQQQQGPPPQVQQQSQQYSHQHHQQPIHYQQANQVQQHNGPSVPHSQQQPHMQPQQIRLPSHQQQQRAMSFQQQIPQQPPPQHVVGSGPPQHQQQQHMHQPQQIRLPSHQQQQQQSMSFQPMQQQQQQMFAPQQAAGHSRPALTAMLHQKHAAAGNIYNEMHPQHRFNFG